MRVHLLLATCLTAACTVSANAQSDLSLPQAISQEASSQASGGLDFVPVVPCRLVDTRSGTGAFGAPELAAGATREFDIPQAGCAIPSTAVAYSLNVTVVPNAALNYLTMWPSGQAQPTVSTLNSLDGRLKANAALTPAGVNGGVSVYASNATQVILDIDGYFVPAGTTSALAFYPVTPCRVVDTRQGTGALGGPSLAGQSTRAFPVRSSGCGIPSTAQAYSLNVTAIPHTTLNYLTTWPTGEPQPNVSTLNSSTGAIAANAAIVPAGTSGDISIFVSDSADVILDVNGYFAAPAVGGLALYPATSCRALDTRSGSGAFSGAVAVPIAGSSCAPPSTAQAFVLNATVVPAGRLDYLTLWPDGEAQPVVSTLNAIDGAITSNMAIVPTANGKVDAFAAASTNLIFDISSYFAAAETPLTNYELTGYVAPVHDPSIIRQNSTYYVFVTDAGQSGDIPIRCSTDRIAWTNCGTVFSALPSWVADTVPGATNIWAPDISYFNGTYHLYYAVSTFGSNTSAIGLATNTTLDQTDSRYKWVDQGPVLTSNIYSNFNAIDPNVLVDSDGSVWLTYGSFWSGIFQQQINPATGAVMSGSTTYHLAERASSVPGDPVEGSSLVHTGGYYYLFVSWDTCCASNPANSNYKIVVGRGTSPHGPFLDESGVDMLSGGGTILLQGNSMWSGPGGQTAYIDPAVGNLIVFHALNLAQNGLDYLFVRSLSFPNGWPLIGTTSVPTPSGITTSTALTTSASAVSTGSPVTLTAAVTAASGSVPLGSVTFNSGTTTLGSKSLNGAGTAALTLSSLAAGTYSITATYAGDSSDAGSTSPAVSVTVQSSTSPGTTTALSASYTTRLEGLPLSIYATVSPASGTATLTGSVNFMDGSALLGSASLDVTGTATLTTDLLAVGSHSVTATYQGNSTYQGSSAAAIDLQITQPATAVYTNPLSLTDPALGAVTSCPDPAVIKAQASGADTWYLYCTGDPHNATDFAAGGGLNNSHLISIYRSTDLVHWTFVRDALPSLPRWAGAGSLAWAPAVKYFNNQYYLYYVMTVTTYAGGSSAIGVATSSSPAGPFTDSGAAAVEPETVPSYMDGGGSYRWVFDADEIQDSSGQRYLLFGSFNGGISVRKLSANGLTTDPASETQIADDQRYEGGAWIEHGGYYYLLVSATNCCAGPLTGYGVFAGRATTPMGPYLDAQGNSLTGTNVGGTPVMPMNGNSLVGPGGGSPFTDEAGQDYYVYHAVTLTAPYFSGYPGFTQRPAAMDAIDWVNGWPTVRGGFGPSDKTAPQPVPAAQPGAANAYTTTLDPDDVPDTAIAGLSDEFNSTTLSSQWSGIHGLPAYTLTGSAIQIPTVNFDTTNAMSSVPILAEKAPSGNYILDTKVSLTFPGNGAGYDYAQAGLVIYGNDNNYLRVDFYSNSDTRQVEFIKQETPEGAGYPTWSATDLGPATVVNGVETAWIRIVKRTVDGKDLYTGYSSVDGVTWVRAGTWTHSLGSASIGIYAGNRAGFNASFDYVHVSTLK